MRITFKLFWFNFRSISVLWLGTFQTSNVICQSMFPSYSLNSFSQNMTIKFQNFDDEIWLKGRGFLAYMVYMQTRPLW